MLGVWMMYHLVACHQPCLHIWRGTHQSMQILCLQVSHLLHTLWLIAIYMADSDWQWLKRQRTWCTISASSTCTSVALHDYTACVDMQCGRSSCKGHWQQMACQARAVTSRPWGPSQELTEWYAILLTPCPAVCCSAYDSCLHTLSYLFCSNPTLFYYSLCPSYALSMYGCKFTSACEWFCLSRLVLSGCSALAPCSCVHWLKKKKINSTCVQSVLTAVTACNDCVSIQFCSCCTSTQLPYNIIVCCRSPLGPASVIQYSSSAHHCSWHYVPTSTSPTQGL